MTTREYFQTVLDAHLSDDMDAASLQLIYKLDEKNAKRKTTLTKEQKEAASRREAVAKFLTEQAEPVTRDTIAEALGMSPAQATAACKALGERVTKSEVKIDKARKVAYSIVK